jgi:Tfp pilus assembly protein PilX
MPNFDKKGAILFIVIGIIVVVVILSTVILRIISNNSRLTHHQVSRIQAEYAAKAGIVYALYMLSTNNAAAEACWSGSGMIMRSTNPGTCVVIEAGLPGSISQVAITVEPIGSGILGTRRVRATADYTYVP